MCAPLPILREQSRSASARRAGRYMQTLLPPSESRQVQGSRRSTRSCLRSLQRPPMSADTLPLTKISASLILNVAVEADACSRLRLLYLHGHVKPISVRGDATPADLDQMIRASYDHLPAIINGTVSMYGFVLLTKVSRGRGTRGVWTVNKRGGEFTVQDLQWCV